MLVAVRRWHDRRSDNCIPQQEICPPLTNASSCRTAPKPALSQLAPHTRHTIHDPAGPLIEDLIERVTDEACHRRRRSAVPPHLPRERREKTRALGSPSPVCRKKRREARGPRRKTAACMGSDGGNIGCTRGNFSRFETLQS